MNKLLACVVFLTISLSCQNVLAASMKTMDGGVIATGVGPAWISGELTPDTITTQIGDSVIQNAVIPDTTVEVSALFADKNSNIGYAQMATTGSSTAYNQYALSAGKWTKTNPQLQYTYYSSGQPTYLNTFNVANDINAATSMWDSKTSKMLFGWTGAAVTGINNKQMRYDSSDGIHEVGWMNLGSNNIVCGGTWRVIDTRTGSIIDADVGFNKQWTGSWTTYSSGPSSWVVDVESIALHEFGHVLGLNDIYDTSKAFDTTEIMNSNRNHRYLGTGDILGLQKLYGC